MGKLIYGMMVSLDGFVAGPDGDLSWHKVDEEIHDFALERERDVSVTFLGRRMYEVMSYWGTPAAVTDRPRYEQEFAEFWKAQRRVVFSTTLQGTDAGSSIERRLDVGAVKQLISQTPGDLSVSGPTLASQFINAGLVDEYQLYQHPVILGDGTPFFVDIERRIELELVEQHRFASGVVFLRYRSRSQRPAR